MNQPTTAHLEAVGNEALQKYLPRNWTIQWLPASKACDAKGIPDDKLLITPHPDTPSHLFILLHELAHIINKDKGYKTAMVQLFGAIALPGNGHVECMASHWAKTYMALRHIEVPDDIWAVAREEWQTEEQMKGVKITP